MRIGCFQLHDPVPELSEPYVLACLRPWIDVNGVGSLVLSELEARLGAGRLGCLSRPGRFYDFTRYRPIIRIEGGIRDFSVPNTSVHYAQTGGARTTSSCSASWSLTPIRRCMSTPS